MTPGVPREDRGTPGTDGAQRRPGPGRLGEAFSAWHTPGRDAILQQPKPQITASTKVLQLVQERDTEPEAAD
jgi:hypothetical protein